MIVFRLKNVEKFNEICMIANRVLQIEDEETIRSGVFSQMDGKNYLFIDEQSSFISWLHYGYRPKSSFGLVSNITKIEDIKEYAIDGFTEYINEVYSWFTPINLEENFEEIVKAFPRQNATIDMRNCLEDLRRKVALNKLPEDLRNEFIQTMGWVK